MIKDFYKLINRLKPFGAKVSACIIDIKTGQRFTYHEDCLLYPASTYKIFIGAEVLRQVETGNLNLSDKITIKTPDKLKRNARLYPNDSFPLLKAGDVVDIDTLLKLMLARSENMASNTLINLVSQKSISRNIIDKNSWIGSGVTQEFLDKLGKGEKYKYADTTRTCGRHLAEFIQKLYTDKLVSPFVSKKLKEYMAIGMDKSLAKKYPHRAPENRLTHTLYEKGGWIQAFSTRLPRLVRRKFYIRYQSQAGAVQINGRTYAVGILCKYVTLFPNRYFKFSEITKWLGNK